MAYPELYSDERIVLQAQNIKVKSVSFEAVLTTRRLVLVDSKKNTIPPQEINLATLKDVERGENAIRDPTITISLITISGNTRQMILTFSKTSGGERKRECDEWVRTLKQHLISSVQVPVTQDIPTFEDEPKAPPKPSPLPPRKIEVTNTPPQKKKIEVARPMKKVVELTPPIPVPVETSSLPSGSFCSRCGNRIPAESRFCNRCGTQVLREGDLEKGAETSQVTPPVPEPVRQVSISPISSPDPVPERKERPIEQVIHSIEPLIEDSVPRREPAPLVPPRQPHMTVPLQEPIQEPPVSSAPEAELPVPAQSSGVQWPVLSSADSPVSSVSAESAVPTHPLPPSGRSPSAQPPLAPKRISLTVVAALAIIVVILLAGAFTYINFQKGTSAESTPVPTVLQTPVPTAIQSPLPTAPSPTMTIVPPVPTPSLFSPPSVGVWVRISYPGNFTGSVGTPNRMSDVASTGDQLYQVPTSEGPVVASVQKVDGSNGELIVEVYKDGALVKSATTIAPKGIIEIQMPLKPSATQATAVPTTTRISGNP